MVAGASEFALIATIAGLRLPGNACWTLSIVAAVGIPFGSASLPICTVWMCHTGSASASSSAVAAIAESSGLRSAGVSTTDEKGSSPFSRRKRLRKGMRPFSTRSPSLESSAGKTVSEPSIAAATTIIVPIANDRYVLSRLKNMPAIAISTVTPEISTERPEVAAAASSAARRALPAARSSRSRLR
jgi:hypothetical protein